MYLAAFLFLGGCAILKNRIYWIRFLRTLYQHERSILRAEYFPGWREMLRETQERIRRAEGRLARETGEEETPGGGLTCKAKADILEERGNPYHGPDGRFTSGPGGGGKKRKTRYAPSKRANPQGITVSKKTFGILRGEFNTKYPGAERGKTGSVSYRGRRYALEADGDGSVIVLKSWKE